MKILVGTGGSLDREHQMKVVKWAGRRKFPLLLAVF